MNDRAQGAAEKPRKQDAGHNGNEKERERKGLLRGAQINFKQARQRISGRHNNYNQNTRELAKGRRLSRIP